MIAVISVAQRPQHALILLRYRYISRALDLHLIPPESCIPEGEKERPLNEISWSLTTRVCLFKTCPASIRNVPKILITFKRHSLEKV